MYVSAFAYVPLCNTFVCMYVLYYHYVLFKTFA